MFGSHKFNSFSKHPGYNLPVAGYIALGIAGVSMVKQYEAQKDATKAQRVSIENQAKMSAVQEQRARVQSVREARLKRAMIEAQTVGQGIGTGSSGYAGGTSSIASQAGANVGYSNVMGGLAEMASKANQQTVSAQAKASMWQTIGGIAQQATPWDKVFGGGIKKSVSSTGSWGLYQ